MDERAMMLELGEILDRLAATPDDAIAERSSLRERQDTLRTQLADVQAERRTAMAGSWAEQAARKTPDDPKPFIPILPGDSSTQA